MDFIIGPVQRTTANGENLKVIPASRSGGSKDRRKKKKDRRKNVREGIFVSLSMKKDRRRPGDRRKTGV